jgi:hypothetical protein
MASKAVLENGLRSGMIEHILNMITEQYGVTALSVSTSEYAVPVKDAEGNNKYILIKVSIPRGTRDGEGGYIPYDGKQAHEDYVMEMESKAQERAVKKAMKEAERGKRNEDEDD